MRREGRKSIGSGSIDRVSYCARFGGGGRYLDGKRVVMTIVVVVE